MLFPRESLLQEAHAFLSHPGENQVSAEEALSQDLAGLPLFDPPLLGISAAHDPLYATLKAPEAIGPWFLSPEEWLPGAASVLSFFFPFSQAVIQSNRQTPDAPSPAWLHGRVEGQALLFRWARHLVALLQAAGWQALCPCLDPRFASMEHRGTDRRFPSQAAFTSRWSERHAAYISGLGTFGLHKGLITERGTCGRFVSVLTDLPLPPTPRPYTGLYDYWYPLRRLRPPLSCGGHLPGGGEGPRGLRLLRGLDHGPLRPPLWLREMPGGGSLPVPQP